MGVVMGVVSVMVMVVVVVMNKYKINIQSNEPLEHHKGDAWGNSDGGGEKSDRDSQ